MAKKRGPLEKFSDTTDEDNDTGSEDGAPNRKNQRLEGTNRKKGQLLPQKGKKKGAAAAAGKNTVDTVEASIEEVVKDCLDGRTFDDILKDFAKSQQRVELDRRYNRMVKDFMNPATFEEFEEMETITDPPLCINDIYKRVSKGYHVMLCPEVHSPEFTRKSNAYKLAKVRELIGVGLLNDLMKFQFGYQVLLGVGSRNSKVVRVTILLMRQIFVSFLPVTVEFSKTSGYSFEDTVLQHTVAPMEPTMKLPATTEMQKLHQDLLKEVKVDELLSFGKTGKNKIGKNAIWLSKVLLENQDTEEKERLSQSDTSLNAIVSHLKDGVFPQSLIQNYLSGDKWEDCWTPAMKKKVFTTISLLKFLEELQWLLNGVSEKKKKEHANQVFAILAKKVVYQLPMEVPITGGQRALRNILVEVRRHVFLLDFRPDAAFQNGDESEDGESEEGETSASDDGSGDESDSEDAETSVSDGSEESSSDSEDAESPVVPDQEEEDLDGATGDATIQGGSAALDDTALRPLASYGGGAQKASSLNLNLLQENDAWIDTMITGADTEGVAKPKSNNSTTTTFVESDDDEVPSEASPTTWTNQQAVGNLMQKKWQTMEERAKEDALTIQKLKQELQDKNNATRHAEVRSLDEKVQELIATHAKELAASVEQSNQAAALKDREIQELKQEKQHFFLLAKADALTIQRQNAELEAANKESNAALSNNASLLQEKEDAHANSEAKAALQEAQLGEAATSRGILAAEVERLNDALANSQQQVVGLNTQIDQLKQQKESTSRQSDNQIQQLQGRLADLQRQDEKIQEEMNRVIQDLRDRVDRRDTTIRALQENLKRTDRTVGTVNNKLHTQLHDAETKNTTLKRQLAEKDQQLSTLQELCEGELTEAHRKNNDVIPPPATLGAPAIHNGGAAPAMRGVQPAIRPPPVGVAAAPLFAPHNAVHTVNTLMGLVGPPNNQRLQPQQNLVGVYPHAAPPTRTAFHQPGQLSARQSQLQQQQQQQPQPQPQPSRYGLL